MIDTHAHLTDERYDGDREEVVKRAKETGVKKIICILVEFDERSMQIFNRLLEHDFIFGAVGIHPHDAKDYEKHKDIFLQLLDLPKIVALGETGLDYHYLNSPAQTQKAVFEKQLQIASERNLPVIIHSREALDDAFSIISNSGIKKAVMHCFSGLEEEAKEYLNLGFYISFAGPVTFKNAKKPKEVIKIIPDDRLLLETDCPYLAPQVFRGERNEPSYIKYIYEEAANLKNISVDKLAGIVSENVFKLFGT
ncbi:hypothetical protein AUJ66_03565 [Candidatus Desantisbacteria bacterium CG1_02_38_46]|uniref:Hydrolase TatD n=3 Tax=unclassified Candidatus Desantisiibacteriota TaxID=3106372 RepID=A0A2H9PBH4_9BACT|nr:MAG: hypothetical protein AUJ66_03565 [Candidatus Desantisbacteria bacterium CG1_02_38_46]PIU52175.1 MAG: hydrolase TatD [Candidatus Desantisbacteria bacterium CG07_land_8_20_14_0_80_39_15]PIZ15263.1 MAG: hydrolase TatD [Candidatus Desantisbacteria bacterium CG_4_10_14_0_8_um_filter_39_17]